MLEPPCDRDCHGGFTYIGLLILIALIGITLAATGQVWHTDVIREKEKELLFVGDQFRKAISAHYANNAASADRYPKSLEELLQDPHQPGIRRYLRKIYVDPLAGKTEWGLIKSPGGGIMGVYSLAEGAPLKHSHFPFQYAGFEGASKYAGWQFAFTPGDMSALVTAPAPGEAPPQNAATIPASLSPPPQAAAEAQKPRARGEHSCTEIAAIDAGACAQQKQKWGSADDCVASAQVRQAACQAGEALPPLYLRYN